MIPLRRTKILLGILIIANVLIYCAYFSIFSILKSKSTETSRLTSEIEEEISRESVRESMENSLLSSGSDADTLKDAIVKADGEIDFISEIEAMAEDLNLKSEIKSVKLEPIKDVKIAEELRMNIDVIGKWSSVYNFLRKLEALPFKIKVTKSNLEKFSEETVGGRASVMWLGQFEFSVVKLKAK